MKELLVQQVDRDREKIIAFLQDFVRARSPNPPGDTTLAAKHVAGFLLENGHPFDEICGRPDMPNLVSSTRFKNAGRHLVLNGHIDVFPATSSDGWSQDPWGGERVDGKIFGRGVSDMKAGSTAALFTYHYLSSMAKEQLGGQLSLALVSDEETFGPWGARYLFEHHPETVKGDCCLIGEPTSPHTVRFGEKGTFWLRFHVKTPGAHGAYTHASESAVITAANVIRDLLTLTELPPPEADNLASAIDQSAEAVDAAYGEGAARNSRRVTVNIGTINGGEKINMVASDVTFEVDIRLPNGFVDTDIEGHIETLLKPYANVEMERVTYNPPSWSAPDHPMLKIIQRNAEAQFGICPTPVVGLAGTDARLWRYHDIPAIVYGPAPNGMASHDEHVTEDALIKLVKTHLCSAWEYLTTSEPA